MNGAALLPNPIMRRRQEVAFTEREQSVETSLAELEDKCVLWTKLKKTVDAGVPLHRAVIRFTTNPPNSM